MDGVLYAAGGSIAGAVEAVQWMRGQRLPHLFVTNTSSRPRAALAEKLLSFGFPATESQILTPVAVAADWLRASAMRDIALFVPPPAQSEFAGLPCLPDDAESDASCVVIGDLGQGWDYRTLNRAFRLLHHNPQATLIALGMSRYWLADDGISLDVAPFVVALEHAAGRKAIVFGKPAADFFRAAAGKLGLPAERVLMVGDDVETDIGGAQSAGLRAALVKTGKFRPADLEGPVQPDLVLDSIAELPNWWTTAML